MAPLGLPFHTIPVPADPQRDSPNSLLIRVVWKPGELLPPASFIWLTAWPKYTDVCLFISASAPVFDRHIARAMLLAPCGHPTTAARRNHSAYSGHITTWGHSWSVAESVFAQGCHYEHLGPAQLVCFWIKIIEAFVVNDRLGSVAVDVLDKVHTFTGK